MSPLVKKVRGDVSQKKSLLFIGIKSGYLRRFRPSERIFAKTNSWVPLKLRFMVLIIQTFVVG